MNLEFVRVLKMPDVPQANTIYMQAIPGNSTMCKLTIVGNTSNDVKHVSSGSVSETVSGGDALHPELDLFKGC